MKGHTIGNENMLMEFTYWKGTNTVSLLISLRIETFWFSHKPDQFEMCQTMDEHKAATTRAHVQKHFRLTNCKAMWGLGFPFQVIVWTNFSTTGVRRGFLSYLSLQS